MSTDRHEYSDFYWQSADGLQLYARDYSPPASEICLPVICLHGLTRNSKDFAGLAELLKAAGHRVIVPDIRGRGLSEYADDPLTYVTEVYADDIIGLLQYLRIDRAIFIGTSMGGIIAHIIAEKNAELVAAVVLNDIGPVAAPNGLARIGRYAGIVPELANWNDAEAYVRRINQAAFPKYTDADWASVARMTFREDSSGKPIFDYDPMIRRPIEEGHHIGDSEIAWQRFASLAGAAPLLVLRGELSDILSTEIVRDMLNIAPTMRVVEIPKVGHAPFLTEAAATSAVMTFVASVSNAG